LMQGTIEVKSKLGEGSTFYIELPRKVQASSAPNFHPSTQLGAAITASERSILTQVAEKPGKGKLLR
jgi:hypothetical protein